MGGASNMAAAEAEFAQRRSDELKDAVAKIGAGQRIAEGDVRPFCWHCQQPIDGDVKTLKNGHGETRTMHPPCWVEVKDLRAQQQERDRAAAIELEVQRVESWFNNCARRGDAHWRATAPLWHWARFDNADYCGRVSPKLLRAFATYDGTESLVVSAKTGGGKTSLTVAWLCRLRERAEQAVRDGKKPYKPNFMFVSGPELAGARRRWELGSESKLVETACDVGLLILDELGFESPGEEIFFVVDARYRNGAPTIVTTGLPIESRDPNAPSFVKRYGAALLRRLLEPGQLVEVE